MSTLSRPFPLHGKENPATTFPYVFGQLRGADRVVVTGPSLRRTATVDRETGGYAVLVPRSAGSRLEVRLLKRDGQ